MHVHTHHFSVTQKQSQPSWLKTEKSGRQVLEIIKFPQGGGYPEKNPTFKCFFSKPFKLSSNYFKPNESDPK